MKKITALILALVLCLSLAGFGYADALTKAEELVEAGDFEGANKVLREDTDLLIWLESLQDLTRSADQGAEGKKLFGTWVSLDGTCSYTFREDGMASHEDSMGNTVDGISFYVVGDRLEMGGMSFPISSRNGVEILGEPGKMTPCLVREAELDTIVETVEITMDNWQDYFELREDQKDPYADPFDRISQIPLFNAWVLREELLDSYLGGQVSAEFYLAENMSYETDWTVNTSGNLDFELEEGKAEPVGSSFSYGELQDRRDWNDNQLSDLNKLVVIPCNRGYVTDGYSSRYEKCELRGIQGTLTLLKQ